MFWVKIFWVNFFCDNYLTTIPEDYQYEYKGYEKIIEDINAHKEVIKKILDKLEDSGDNYCYEIHSHRFRFWWYSCCTTS